MNNDIQHLRMVILPEGFHEYAKTVKGKVFSSENELIEWFAQDLLFYDPKLLKEDHVRFEVLTFDQFMELSSEELFQGVHTFALVVPRRSAWHESPVKPFKWFPYYFLMALIATIILSLYIF